MCYINSNLKALQLDYNKNLKHKGLDRTEYMKQMTFKCATEFLWMDSIKMSCIFFNFVGT